ncbi:hypothetical protein M0L20_26535 [Spirosoma sp. RP8]|uniref:Uncharacterized protein n=1 Tax=Spirosoma liriopis TaxID=2937440 RepID=A0ABT0HTG1_9BACT|nr:hypothetical protein [Spirosoma liriopis]MCK8495451.1 hypothetical protein [Spirosoma liriopis]
MYSAQTIAHKIDLLNGYDYACFLNTLEQSQGVIYDIQMPRPAKLVSVRTRMEWLELFVRVPELFLQMKRA